MGKTQRREMSKSQLLVLALALFVVTYATEISSVQYNASGCTGTESASTDTLGACTSVSGYPNGITHTKLTLAGTIYSYGWYSDSACTTAVSGVSPSNPITGAACDCVEASADGMTTYFKVTEGGCSSNAASRISIGILSVFLGVMAQWYA